MTRTTRSGRIRSWVIRIGIALLIFEVLYVVAANSSSEGRS